MVQEDTPLVQLKLRLGLFGLVYALYFRACQKDAETLCRYSAGKWREHRSSNSTLVNCLWSHRHPARLIDGKEPIRSLSAPCLRELSNLMLIRASSVDLNPEVFQACLSDLGKFCDPSSRPSEIEDEDDYWDGEEEEEKNEMGMSCLGDHMNQLQVHF